MDQVIRGIDDELSKLKTGVHIEPCTDMSTRGDVGPSIDLGIALKSGQQCSTPMSSNGLYPTEMDQE
eukprot:4181043-Prorocentrum_lima.AAC.1